MPKPKLPALTGKQTIKALVHCGFVIVRQKGSHVILKHTSNVRLTVVPVHAGKTLKKPLLRAIIEQDAGLELSEFLKNL